MSKAFDQGREDVAWDGDSEQRWQLAGEQVVNHDTVREQTGEDA